ncbi:hypothetical protein [Streptomyces sp. YS-3]|uniref:hypothetical protein n=1 Tax=Streptomyces sp. YS-3 TaxID=3381352 RepID=UPI00386271E8
MDYVMSGPHKGQAIPGTEGIGELQIPHPDRPGVLCRYSTNDGDGPITGLPGAVQVHYVGDVATIR